MSRSGGSNTGMNNIYSLLMTVLFTLTALVSCATGPDLTVDDLNNTIWTGPVQSSSANQPPGLEGFYLAPGGRLMTLQSGTAGDDWKLEGNKLILGTHNTETSENQIWEYTLRNKDGIQSLYPSLKVKDEPLQGRTYMPESLTGVWHVLEIFHQESIDTPRDSESWLEILSDENGLSIQGFGGVNRFRGSLKAEDLSWKSGPLMRTLMAGPFLQFEDLFMHALDRADSFLSLDNRLYLYQGTELLAVFSRG